MKIIVFQDSLLGLWHYAPEAAVEMFRRDADNGVETKEEALALARRDRSIPKGTVIKVEGE